MSGIDRRLLRILRRIVGRRNLLRKPHQLLAHSYDATNRRHPPELVVRVTERGQVAPVLAACRAAGVPLTPRGAGTGFTGGSLPLHGGVVLLLDRLNRIIEIDPARRTAVVEPGVVTAELQTAVEQHGLFYPPDPASLKISTLGGNYAENAGGPRCVSFGVTADWIRSALIALPDGTLIDTAAEPGLTQLYASSEGTLGVTVELRLQLMERPPTSATARAVFDSPVAAGRGVTGLLARGLKPAKLEFMDAQTLACVARYRGEPEPEPGTALLLVELLGGPEEIEADLRIVRAVFSTAGAPEVLVALDETEQEDLWSMRRDASPAIAGLKPLKVNEDVVVPRGRLPELVARLESLRKNLDLLVPVFGHAGDGNLHVNIMCDPADAAEMARVERALDKLFTAVLQLGGSISGEHGIGVAKQPFIDRELPAELLELSRRLKSRLDPNGLLNPAKIFPSTDR